MTFKTIVLGYDGSTYAIDALETAVALSSDDTTVHVVTAFDAPTIREINDLYASVPEEFTRNIDLVTTQRGPLDKAEIMLDERGVAHKGHFVDEDPASAILDVADRVDADLIVVGSRGLGRATRLVRGSVSSKIANHAQRSFLVVHPPEEDD